LIFPLKPVFESDGCRYIQNGPASAFVTRRLKIFWRRTAFEAPAGVEEKGVSRFSVFVSPNAVFVSPNLAASVRRNNIVRLDLELSD
jgi:hypothetical protein